MIDDNEQKRVGPKTYKLETENSSSDKKDQDQEPKQSSTRALEVSPARVAKYVPGEPAHRIPDDFQLTDQMRNYAVEKGLRDADNLFEDFKLHWQASGSKNTKKINWILAFYTWVRNELKWNGTKYYGKEKRVHGNASGVEKSIDNILNWVPPAERKKGA